MKRIAYLGWGAATLLGVYSALAVKAPEIERDVDRRVEAAIAAAEPIHPLDVATDGRSVTLRGVADSEIDRDALGRLAGGVWGALGPSNQIEVLPRRDPYPFAARRDGERVTVSGAAPSEAERVALEQAVRARFGDGAETQFELAAGAPDRAWTERLTPALDALALLDAGELAVEGDAVRLSGLSRSEARLDAARAAAAAAPEGQAWTLDLALDKPEVRPFTLTVAKSDAGAVTSRGFAPDADARAAIAAAAAGLAEGGAAAAEIALANGAPRADWADFALERIAGLAPLEAGELTLTDDAARLVGRAGSLEAAFAAEDAVGAGAADLTLAPYGLAAERARNGALSLRAAAPDAAARASLEAAAARLGGPAADVRLIGAAGADAGWTARAEAALDALGRLDRGRLEIRDGAVRLSGATTSARALAEVEAAAAAASAADPIGAPWALDLTLERPRFAPYPLDVAKDEAGAVTLRGGAPDAAGAELLRAAAERLDGRLEAVDLTLADGLPSSDWVERAAALTPLLDLLESGRLEIRDGAVRLLGVTATPELAATATARLAVLAGPNAQARLKALDPRPAAAMTIQLDANSGVRLDGVLPQGLSSDEVVDRLGLGSANTALLLDTGGRGDAARWREGLDLLGEFLPEFETLAGSVTDDRYRLDGALLAESDLAQVDGFLEDGLGALAAVDLGLSRSAIAYPEGERRVNAVTGRAEVFRGGFWLPEVAVAASEPGDCTRASELVLLDNTIRFLVGSAELDVRARRIVNELSAIAVACLGPTSPLALEIGGHTDSTGADDFNMALSEARAAAVRAALAERGVPSTAMTAIGYGETRPIADNGDEDGRAQNRRISFLWLPRETPPGVIVAPVEAEAPTDLAPTDLAPTDLAPAEAAPAEAESGALAPAPRPSLAPLPNAAPSLDTRLPPTPTRPTTDAPALAPQAAPPGAVQ